MVRISSDGANEGTRHCSQGQHKVGERPRLFSPAGQGSSASCRCLPNCSLEEECCAEVMKKNAWSGSKA